MDKKCLRQWRKKLKYWAGNGRTGQTQQRSQKKSQKRVSPPQLIYEDFLRNGLDPVDEEFKEQDSSMKLPLREQIVFFEDFEGEKRPVRLEVVKDFIEEEAKEKDNASCDTGMGETPRGLESFDTDFDFAFWNFASEFEKKN